MTVKKKIGKFFFGFDRYNLSKKTFFHQNSSKNFWYYQIETLKMYLLLKFEVTLMSTLEVIAFGNIPLAALSTNDFAVGRGSRSSSP